MPGVFIWELGALVRDTNYVDRKSLMCWFQQLIKIECVSGRNYTFVMI